MASASTEGHIAFWDLEKRQLGTVLRDAHKGVVCGMKFLPSQPLLVTNGPDNSLKVSYMYFKQKYSVKYFGIWFYIKSSVQ